MDVARLGCVLGFFGLGCPEDGATDGVREPSRGESERLDQTKNIMDVADPKPRRDGKDERTRDGGS
jgi:hypothetical protein